MLEWIWFFVLLFIVVGLTAWDSYYVFSDNSVDNASMMRVLISICCLLLSLYVKSDLLVEAPYHWLLNVLPEPNTTINWFTTMVLTALLVIAYLFFVVLGTYFLTKRLARRSKGANA